MLLTVAGSRKSGVQHRDREHGGYDDPSKRSMGSPESRMVANVWRSSPDEE
jgi:hypothetical protein